MKYILSVAIFVAFYASCKPSTNSTESVPHFDTTKLSKGQSFYQCEMDTTVISDKPGKCPVCGMDLIEIEKQ